MLFFHYNYQCWHDRLCLTLYHWVTYSNVLGVEANASSFNEWCEYVIVGSAKWLLRNAKKKLIATSLLFGS